MHPYGRRGTKGEVKSRDETLARLDLQIFLKGGYYVKQVEENAGRNKLRTLIFKERWNRRCKQMNQKKQKLPVK